ncbi:CaiB/BaiF CoA transferase family protein [[Mycobacterium] holstebronense]|uniref:CaiB/BaiF CoA-transferase family protein n=1 Tax=[Mycobacterium] holstebronense TaxID=3064288 RepID=A0ABM9LGH3_9MYCO|nr:CaiB/BaiF CoA-transferase family protein [Mycolicibacter sp. MU0102]CAJ1498600.1 CaiB/BaiF CoA-transferase family protein [Mycolicibacter sp. MU0102]
MPQPSTAPLAGITVVALEQAVSAPMCTRALADFGARVIKVENPDGGDFARYYDDVVHGQAAHFVWVNRGKESVALDLKSEAGRDVLRRILDRADVLVSNLAPGATARLGLSPEQMAHRHPNVIAVEIDGYGAGGPLSHKRAYDLLVQAESGVCSVTGSPGAPAKPGPPVADVTTGLYAALSIMALLVGRKGAGAHADSPAPSVSVSLFDTMAEMMGYHLTYARHSGIDQQPLGMSSPAVAPYGAYPTADGHTVVLGTTNDREWQRLARELLGRNDLADDPRFSGNADRVANRAILDEAIAAWCVRHELAHIQDAADAAGIGNARYNTPSDVLAHPQLAARDRWHSIDTPAGAIPSLLPPPVISGYQSPMGAVPGLGEHTDTVLDELGLTGEEIVALRANGVIRQAGR